MAVIDTIPTVTFWTEPGSSLRIGKTRVTLNSVAYDFFNGSTPEEIANNYPALRLSEVYGVISYILENRVAVEKYLVEEEVEGDRIEAELRKKYGAEWAESRNAMYARAVELGIRPRS